MPEGLLVHGLGCMCTVYSIRMYMSIVIVIVTMMKKADAMHIHDTDE